MDNDLVWFFLLALPAFLIAGTLILLFFMAVIGIGRDELPPNGANQDDDCTWGGNCKK